MATSSYTTGAHNSLEHRYSLYMAVNIACPASHYIVPVNLSIT